MWRARFCFPGHGHGLVRRGRDHGHVLVRRGYALGHGFVRRRCDHGYGLVLLLGLRGSPARRTVGIGFLLAVSGAADDSWRLADNVREECRSFCDKSDGVATTRRVPNPAAAACWNARPLLGRRVPRRDGLRALSRAKDALRREARSRTEYDCGHGPAKGAADDARQRSDDTEAVAMIVSRAERMMAMAE